MGRDRRRRLRNVHLKPAAKRATVRATVVEEAMVIDGKPSVLASPRG
jgi:hypothetical protein